LEDKNSRARFCSDKCRLEWHNKWYQTPWGTVPLLDPELPGFEELWQDRETYIAMAKNDPFLYGDVLPHWIIADQELDATKELMVSGGNRSGKTLWAARKAVQCLLEGDGDTGGIGKNVICCHTSNATSVTVQQPAVYRYLPRMLKGTKKSKTAYLNYSLKNGFTDGSFILPNLSRCDFLNYTQSENTIEGREADLVWCDELVPRNWIESLKFRLISRKGKLIVTQTPLEGVSSVYGDFVSAGRVTEWGDAPMLNGRSGSPTWLPNKAPRKVDGMFNRKSVFFFTSDNPFSPYSEMEAKLAGAPIPQVLVRAYGWASDQVGKAFARFRADVHTIRREQIRPNGTLYQVVDPAGSRNWFCIWALAYEDGSVCVIREFPDLPSYGEWAVPGEKQDGKMGPAQTANASRGVSEYRDIFRSIETELGLGEPLVRWIDPKSGGSATVTQEGGLTLIDVLAMESDGNQGMAFIPSPGLPVDQRHAAINTALSFDPTKPLTGINQPKLSIVDDCYNTIWCLSEHTGYDGQKGASKDPIDCLGMLCTSQSDYVSPTGMNSFGGGSY
jgi:phage terminase large subunit-like protein